MRPVPIELVPEASDELEAAFDWYLERSDSSAAGFLRAVEAALGTLADVPELSSRFEAGTRRYVLRDFPFSLIYRASPGLVQVIAVAHHRRRPRYWQSR